MTSARTGSRNLRTSGCKRSNRSVKLFMATPLLPADFKEFLKLLNSRRVEYLLIGGYAVGYYGYPRATADIDIWIAINSAKAPKRLAGGRAYTSSPGLNCRARDPTPTTTPAKSLPRMSGKRWEVMANPDRKVGGCVGLSADTRGPCGSGSPGALPGGKLPTDSPPARHRTHDRPHPRL